MKQHENHQWIRKRLPHRWPFLHVDRVTKIADKSIEGYKNVSAADSVFMGHFPEVSVLPGVVVVEALAQLSGLLLIAKEEAAGEAALVDAGEEAIAAAYADMGAKIGLLTSIRGFKFIKIIEPGDQLFLKSILKGNNGDAYIFAVSAYVEQTEVAVGEIQIYLQNREVVL